METPFCNDPFAILWIAFEELYPDKKCICRLISPSQKKSLKNETTVEFYEGGEIGILLDTSFPHAEMIDSFGMALAMAAVGDETGIDRIGAAQAYEEIMKKYAELLVLFLAEATGNKGEITTQV